jgi:hypothetical protein
MKTAWVQAVSIKIFSWRAASKTTGHEHFTFQDFEKQVFFMACGFNFLMP